MAPGLELVLNSEFFSQILLQELFCVIQATYEDGLEEYFLTTYSFKYWLEGRCQLATLLRK